MSRVKVYLLITSAPGDAPAVPERAEAIATGARRRRNTYIRLARLFGVDAGAVARAVTGGGS